MHLHTLKQRIVTGLCLAVGLLVATQAVQADTIGYWRFEEGAFLKNSVTDGDMTLVSPDPQQVALPASGAGAAFPDPIPLTGQTNQSAASLAGGSFITDITGQGSNTAFTVEALFNTSDLSGTAVQGFASLWGGSTSSRKFFFGINNATDTLRAGVYGTGGQSTGDSQLAVEANTDYYAAFVFDGGTVTFYLKDLTNNGALLTETQVWATTTLQSANFDMRVGALGGGGNSFFGVLDEVRLSNTALVTSELLIVPEPASLALLAAGTLMCLRRRKSVRPRERPGSSLIRLP